jgi:hypothetical protein
MKQAIQTIQLGPKTIEYKGLQQLADVVAYVYVDEHFEIDWDMPADERAELERQLERGNITACGIEVRAALGGIEGADSCWGFLVRTPTDIMDAIRDHGMADNACAELVREIADAVVAARNVIERFG